MKSHRCREQPAS
jgi:hypothetical protein